ncbi:helix-turn-helix transcriptional regulator [Romeria aff. gracilis LEGE 07310]|uniref:Helix-turn-helix transcriptional regulator n=1 Tax=Vasconcelosia minhoensis LEGE 07310 TaxID=915328 RepID=A0A8J7A9F8_9CYAN|nr:helix-turn-helix domain-containing protein [Romeria gracilis]MBE9078610.1 helix-turn-helix transcriptional regulator [Romeria aff. gracilis LEGE 07310]
MGKCVSDYGCSVEAALDVIGGKWKGVVLYHLLEGKRRFGELQRLMPGVTRRMLTLSLRELEEEGIVHREVYKQVPPKVEYSLTEYGRTLEPIILSLRTWGEIYMQKLKRSEENALAAQAK